MCVYRRFKTSQVFDLLQSWKGKYFWEEGRSGSLIAEDVVSDFSLVGGDRGESICSRGRF